MGKHIDFHRLFVAIMLTLSTAAVFMALGYAIGRESVNEDQALTVNTPSPKTTASKTASATATAGTTKNSIFKHKELNFSFEVPEGYAVVDSYNCEGACMANITIAKLISDISFQDAYIKISYGKLDQSVDQLIKDDKIGSDKLSEDVIKVDEKAGKKIGIGGFASGYYYYVENNGYDLQIKQYPNNDENQKVVDKILSTFKFTP